MADHEAMILYPGGRFSIDNPGAGVPSVTFSRSADGTTIGFDIGTGPPAELDIAFLRYLLSLCGYIVMAREDIARVVSP